MHFSIVAILLVSIAVTGLLMPMLIKLFLLKRLVDNTERRKIHDREIPTMGGTGFFGAFMITLLLFGSYEQLAAHRVELLTISVMFVVGLRDDLIELRPVSKLIAQLVPAFLLIYLSNLVFLSFYNFLGIGDIPYWFGVTLSLLTIIGLTNSFNLIDGLDGLACSLALLGSLVFGSWFYYQGVDYYSFIAFAFAGSLIGFLYYNWQPAKIFMGDTGALVIGFLLAILAIRFIEYNAMLPAGTFLKFNSGITLAISILIVPIFDTLRIIIVRLILKRSPFVPDKNHTHHMLLRLGFSHAQSTLILVFVNIAFIGLAFSLDFLGDNMLMPIIISLAVSLSFVLNYFVRKRLASRNFDAKGTRLEVIKSHRKAS